MHVACRWKDDVESTKNSDETGKENSTWQRLVDKNLGFWGIGHLTHPLRIMVPSLIYMYYVYSMS
jgi:hypothetical protein